jgi:predicted metallopeptidase
MAMPRRLRKVREPAVPVVFAISGEIETVMHRLIRLNPVQFGWANNFKLGCVLVTGAKAKEQGGCVILARFVKVPPLWHGLTGYDAIIRVEDWAWHRLNASQQEALITHELCHGSMSEKGALRVMKHDLEEFGFVVRKYGPWQENIALFDKQLSMFEPGFGTSQEGEQKVVPFARPASDADVEPEG